MSSSVHSSVNSYALNGLRWLTAASGPCCRSGREGEGAGVFFFFFNLYVEKQWDREHKESWAQRRLQVGRPGRNNKKPPIANLTSAQLGELFFSLNLLVYERIFFSLPHPTQRLFSEFLLAVGHLSFNQLHSSLGDAAKGSWRQRFFFFFLFFLLPCNDWSADSRLQQAKCSFAHWHAHSVSALPPTQHAPYRARNQ